MDKLAVYKEAAERADDTIAALRQTVQAMRECIDTQRQAFELVMGHNERLAREAAGLRTQYQELAAKHEPFRREFGL